MKGNKPQIILGLVWVALGLWTLLTTNPWLGVGWCAVGVAYLAYAIRRARTNPAP